MDSKKAIKKAVSLAVLSALVQNNQINGHWYYLNPLKFTKKVVKATGNKVFKWGKRGFELYCGSALGTGSRPKDGLVALAHMTNSCWVNTLFSSLMSQLTIDDIETIEQKLNKYTNNWEIVKVADDKQNILCNSMRLLRLFIKDIREVREKERTILSQELQAACGYNGRNGGDPITLLKRLQPALEHCGFRVELACWDIPKKIKELEAGGCKRYTILINDKEPGGHAHVYFICVDLIEKKCYEINDMTGGSYQGYVDKLDLNTVAQKVKDKGMAVFAIVKGNNQSHVDSTNKLLSCLLKEEGKNVVIQDNDEDEF